jgi:hypothetical protein
MQILQRKACCLINKGSQEEELDLMLQGHKVLHIQEARDFPLFSLSLSLSLSLFLSLMLILVIIYQVQFH